MTGLLSPSQIAEIRERHEVRLAILKDGAFFATEGAQDNHNDIAALLSHISALERELIARDNYEREQIKAPSDSWFLADLRHERDTHGLSERRWRTTSCGGHEYYPRHVLALAVDKLERERKAPDEAIAKIENRERELRKWLNENSPYVFVDQKHLDANTTERAYWHYGNVIALRDVLALFTAPKEETK